MISRGRFVLVFAAALAGAGVISPLCISSIAQASTGQTTPAAQAPDTATVRLHISGMTCGSCPATARLALRRLPGVYSAAVTLDDSLGIVRYDPRQLTSAQVVAYLTRLTGFRATVLPDLNAASRSPGTR